MSMTRKLDTLAGSGGIGNTSTNTNPANTIPNYQLPETSPLNISDLRLLQRELDVVLTDLQGNGISLKSAKLVVEGNKYIGVQQDTFSIVTYNVKNYMIARWVEEGKSNVLIRIDGKPVFAGVITNITTGAPDIVSQEIVITCLSRTTVFLTNLVKPFSLPSSMNAYNIMKVMLGDGVEIPPELKDVYVDSDVHTEGNFRNDLDSIVRAVNAKVGENQWFEIKYDHDRIDLLSSSRQLTYAYLIDGKSGLVEVPKISESGLSFKHAYRTELTPGVAIHIDNALLSTLGANSAFLFTMDPNGTYMVTHVKYKFQNYDGASLVCEVECYPYSKFKNWSVK